MVTMAVSLEATADEHGEESQTRYVKVSVPL